MCNQASWAMQMVLTAHLHLTNKAKVGALYSWRFCLLARRCDSLPCDAELYYSTANSSPNKTRNRPVEKCLLNLARLHAVKIRSFTILCLVTASKTFPSGAADIDVQSSFLRNTDHLDGVPSSHKQSQGLRALQHRCWRASVLAFCLMAGGHMAGGPP